MAHLLRPDAAVDSGFAKQMNNPTETNTTPGNLRVDERKCLIKLLGSIIKLDDNMLID